jgi:hypothetical protein
MCVTQAFRALSAATSFVPIYAAAHGCSFVRPLRQSFALGSAPTPSPLDDGIDIQMSLHLGSMLLSLYKQGGWPALYSCLISANLPAISPFFLCGVILFTVENRGARYAKLVDGQG